MLGPEPSVARAMDRIGGADRIDGAVLDVNLGGEQVFPVADTLCARSIPFLFATGHRDASLAARYPAAPRFDKPLDVRGLLGALRDLVQRVT